MADLSDEGINKLARKVNEEILCLKLTDTVISECTKDQQDLIHIFRDSGKSFLSNEEVYVAYGKKHHTDSVKDRRARTRNILQRNCETSKQFKNGDGKKIFRTSSRGFWGLTPEW